MLMRNDAPFFEKGASILISTTAFKGRLYSDRFEVRTSFGSFEVRIVQDTWHEMDFFALKCIGTSSEPSGQIEEIGKNIISLEGLEDVQLSINEFYGDELMGISVRRITFICSSGRASLSIDDDQTRPGEFIIDYDAKA